MSNWRTAVELVKLDTHRAKEPVDINRAEVAVARAFEHFASTPFWFNQETAYWKTVSGTQKYIKNLGNAPYTEDWDETTFSVLDSTIPHDLQIPLDRRTYLKTTGDIWSPLKMVTMDEIRYYTYNSSTTGYPTVFGYFNEAIYLYSVPNDEYGIRMDYVKSEDIPVVRHPGGGTSFKVYLRSVDPEDPTTVQYNEVTDPWEHPFLEHAMDLITARARWEIYTQHHDDQENAVKESQVVEDALTRLRRETDNRLAPIGIQPTEV